MMHPAFSYSCITLDKIRDMAKKKHKGHYCKICGEYKSNESFSGKGHAQHICKECMDEMKKDNKKILDLPSGMMNLKLLTQMNISLPFYMATTKNEKPRLSRNSAVTRKWY